LGAHSLQAPANDQTHAFRDLELSDLNVREPAPLIVEHSPFLSEMPEYLFDEEGIPLGLSEDPCTRDAGGSGAPSEARRSVTSVSGIRRSATRSARRWRVNRSRLFAKGRATSSSTSRYVPRTRSWSRGRCGARYSSKRRVESSA